MVKTNGHRPRWNAYALRRGGGWCKVRLDADNRILEASAVSCVWSGTTRFDRWFRGQYPIARIEPFERAA